MEDKTRELAYSLSNGYCRCKKECTKQATQIHHMLPNTRQYRKLYPLFMDSIFNLCPVNHDCHMSGMVPRISAYEASVYERWLNER